jgi:penicillin amidase
MMARRRGNTLFGRLVNLAAALVVGGAVLFVSARGFGPLPPFGPAFVPGTGVWSVAADARLPTTEVLHLPELQRPATVVFEHLGTAHIRAATDHDLWLVNGYLHARFRLFQLDLLRRLGEGLLSQAVGSAALDSDKFELKLGLRRTAEAEWRQLPANDPARLALLAYSKGVNDGIQELESHHNLPVLFKLLGYQPKSWTPIDTLVVQGDETQDLDFTDTPLDYALLVRHLGYQRTMRWFPVLPVNGQHPYDPGPYQGGPPAPIPSQASVGTPASALVSVLATELAALPPGAVHRYGASNNWAVDGTKTASGKPLLAGDPHLHQTLPAIWYELSGDSPGFHFSGVGIPGTPGIIIGRNRHISWSLTDTQNQSTLYYLERTDQRHRYYWRGAWHPMRRLHYAIPVKGSSATHYEVDLTVHGPLTTSARVPGHGLAIWWAGALPSSDIDALLGVMRASTFDQFRRALGVWHAPTQNFIYADDGGNIGIIAPGYYPIVPRGIPWLPLPGLGPSDVAGTIPYGDVPQAYDPPNHILFSANQRPVTGAYPYYIGTSLDFFDTGYRAARIQRVLSGGSHLSVASMEALQNDVHDFLAQEIVPKLLAAVPVRGLTPLQRRARAQLARWDGGMTARSPAASIWWYFWQRYLRDTFDPWWSAAHVPSSRFHSVRVGSGLAPLDEDLEDWTLHDQGNAVFSPPEGPHRTAGEVMRRAFVEAVGQLADRLGPDPTTWRWGTLHKRTIESFAQVSSLQYGPRASGGDPWTVNAADGGMTSSAGPSWRFIMDWGNGRAQGVYPGGQSENPLSPWYRNQINAWWKGLYYPLLSAAAAAHRRGAIVWTMHR